MRGLRDRVAIVTGGAGGIGRATCLRFAGEGAKVAIFDRDAEGAEKVRAEIAATGAVAAAYAVDITDHAAVLAAVQATEAELGPVHVLVNNAGWDVFRPFVKTDPELWQKIIAINLVGALNLSHIVAGTVETSFVLLAGETSFHDFVLRFFLPTLAGNVLGGVSLVAALGHAQVEADKT